MSLISEQLPNLMNGVSQQALSMRLTSQAERQVNGQSSIVEGVHKRMPLQFLTQLFPGDAGDVFVHMINRDVSERYVVTATDGNIRVFELDGTERTVTYPDGTSYLSTTSPSNDFRAISLADTTFIVNKQVAVAESAAEVSPTSQGEAQVFIRQVAYDTAYAVRINGVDYANYLTADAYGTNPKVSINEVTIGLGTQLQTNLGAGWQVDILPPIIHIRNLAGLNFNVECDDTNGKTMSRAIPGRVQRFTDLPVVGKHGYIVRVVVYESSDYDLW